MKILTQFKQYGFKNSINRVFKKLLRYIGIKIECYIYYKQEIEIHLIERVNINPKYIIRKLQYNDYMFSKGLQFDDFKLAIFKKRFEDKFYEAFGVYDNDKLIYSTWISTKDVEISVNTLGLELEEDEALLLDIITHPEYRRQGLHNFMNIFCLERIMELNKTKAVVLVLKENIPARKSQERSGFIKSKIITHCSLWGNEYIKIKNI